MKIKHLISALIVVCVIDPHTNVTSFSENKVLEKEHLNLLICSDLSNRLTVYQKPIEDSVLINSLLQSYYPKIYNSNGRGDDQKDRIEVLLLNGMNIKNFKMNPENLIIDLSEFNDFERSQYLKDEVQGFKRDKRLLIEEVNKLYRNATLNTQEADVFSLFQSKLKFIETKNEENEKYRNILILFTDGYIEYGSIQQKNNKLYFLNQKAIDNFRKIFNASNETSLEKFLIKNKYGIMPVDNPQLDNLEVLVIELYDRSLSTTRNATKRPTDLEIMKLFWYDWMKKSKVKRFKSYQVFHKESDFIKAVIDFIEHPSKYVLN